MSENFIQAVRTMYKFHQNNFPPSRLAAVAFSIFAATVSAQSRPAYLDPALPATERAHDLVSRMTLDEKATQLEDWAVAIPRLGVPDYQTWSEALHGVANSGYATVFPQAIGMAATWDKSLVQQVGDIISTEGRAKYNLAQREGNHRIFYGLTFWSPNINIFRDPRWGRGQETYGEDPFLTGKIAGAFISGVQGPDPDHPKAVATSKHFAVHSGPESQRHTFDAVVSPRDLEETYLPAFRSTVIDAHVKSVMCAYNAIDGHSACANTMLLKDHLRDAWHFKGFVVSDCAAIVDVTKGHGDAPDITHAAAISLKAGTDLSCSIWSPGFNKLADAVREHLVSEDLVTQAAERLYTARFQLGLFDTQGSSSLDMILPSVIDSAAHRDVARKAAEESMVLLKNDGALPLANNVRSIAVIGPTADLLPALEGNYNGQPIDPISPLDGIRRQFPSAVIHYAQGSTLADGISVPVPRTVFTSGLKAEYFASKDWTGRPVAETTEPEIQHDWRDASPNPSVQTNDYSVRWSGKLQVPAAGKYTFILEGISSFPYSPTESYRFVLDGKVLSEGNMNGKKLDMGNFTVAPGASPSAPPVMSGSKPAHIEVTLNDTAPHTIEIGYSHSGDRAGGGITLKWEAPAQALLDEAVQAASKSDLVIAFTGLSPQLEGEEMPIKIEGFSGGDRTSIALPAVQQKLLEAIAGSKKPVIVVNLSGSAVALTWAKDHAAAILQAWYPGEQGGTAIARTLAGLANPSGRLPVTFYAGTEDLPAFTDYSMKNRTYRYYQGKPLWSFGYGLSYSKFDYSALHLSSTSLEAGKPLTATVKVHNASQRAGDEVVEAFLKTPQTDGPIRSLAAFERVHLAPGESREVSLTFNDRALSSVSASGERSVIPGTYHLAIGSTQPSASTASADFTVRGTAALPK
jgi:beta-glucosidase